MNMDKGTPPSGTYGVWAEPRGHMNNPRWITLDPMTYDEAIEKSDFMNRANKLWHYYAKPI